MSSILDLDLASARSALQKKEVSAVELTETYLSVMSSNDHLNCYITSTPEKALDMASKSDHRINSGDALPLDGIPIAIKDLFCCLLYTSPSPRDQRGSRMPSSA